MDRDEVTGSHADTQQIQRRARGFRRTYKACHLCRRKKTRCIVETRDSKCCLRCQREGRECIFPTDRSAGNHIGDHTSATFEAPCFPARSRTPQPSSSRDDLHHQRHASTNYQHQSHLQTATHRSAAAVHPESWPPPSTSTNATDQAGHPERIALDKSGTVSNAADLTNSIIRTIVSNENDAIRLLFRAAVEQDGSGNTLLTPGHASDSSLSREACSSPSATASGALLQLWNAFRFVKMGWFTAEEGIMFVELFFRNLAPLSLITRGMDATYEGHFRLISKEPLLCCVILLISTRYHHLPKPGGVARGILVHNRLWEHCQHLIMRIITGQEKGSTARTRTRGSVEALLLLVEWHPRAVYFPPVPDGWDSTLLHSAFSLERTDDYGTREVISDESCDPAWQRDVVKPARTSDRMAWMLLGIAQTLALELGIYDTTRAEANEMGTRQPGLHARSGRVREVLYILMEQHSFRLGCPTMMPDSLARTIAGHRTSKGMDEDSRVAWAWIDLTTLLRSIHDMLFPTAGGVRELLRTKRYASITRHFQQQLTEWRKRFLDTCTANQHVFEELHIEYHHARALMNSLGVQAIVERVVKNSSASPTIQAALNSTVQSTEYDFIREVIDGSVNVLKATQRLSAAGLLRYCPVRVYLRVIVASIFLLKALSLGTHAADLKSSLTCLHEGIACLGASSTDEGDFASRYAALLEVFLAKFEQSMVPSTAPPTIPTIFGELAVENSGDGQCLDMVDGDWATLPDDWLALPLSHSLAPFQIWGEAPDMAEPEVSFWDTMWNLPQI